MVLLDFFTYGAPYLVAPLLYFVTNGAPYFVAKVHLFLKRCLHNLPCMKKEILFTKPYQASPSWRQLKDLVFINWKNTVSKMN